MNIREAIDSDGPELARMRWEFSPEQTARGRQTLEEFTLEFSAYVANATKEGRWKIWVADSGTGLIGNLYVEIIPKLPRPGEFKNRYAYMTNVYVAEKERNRGVGARLVEAAVAWAKSAGIEFIVVWPSTESVAFYERQNFHRSEAMQSIF